MIFLKLPEPHETQEKLIQKITCYVQCWLIYRTAEKGYK